MELGATVAGYNYHFTKIDDLTSDRYTLVTISLDCSGSVSQEADNIKSFLDQMLVELKSDKVIAPNVMVRVLKFGSTVDELCGFTPIQFIDTADVVSKYHIGGRTELYGACVSAYESTYAYAKTLSDNGYIVNGVSYVITDGQHFGGGSINDYKNSKNKHTNSEVVSWSDFLISVSFTGADTSSIQRMEQDLENFKTVGDFTDYVHFADASGANLLKLGNMIVNSVKSVSKSLSSGTSPAASLSIV